MNSYSDWRGVVPQGYEVCPKCGSRDRISRDNPNGLELGCRWCDDRVVLPPDDPAMQQMFHRKLP